MTSLDTSPPLDPSTPLVVVTAASGGDVGGCLVAFHSQSGISPLRYAVWLARTSHTCGIALRATHLAIHFLDRDSHASANLFGRTSGAQTDKFSKATWSPGPNGVPLLDACTARLVVRRSAMWDDGGDHICFVGESADAQITTALHPLRVGDVLHTIGPGSPPDVEISFDRDLRAPLHARHALAPLISDDGDPIAFAVETVASELVSNVVLHTPGGGTLRAWDPKPDVPFRLEVSDSTRTPPQQPDAANDDGGRGIRIVDQLSDRWGVTAEVDGKTIWAEFDRNLDSGEST